MADSIEAKVQKENAEKFKKTIAEFHESIVMSEIAAAEVATAMVADNAVTTAKVSDEGTLTQSAIKRSIHKSWILGA